MRRMMPGETHADFAAGLRDVVGRNRVSERVLLAQFYRCLDKTTKKLVKQDPQPRTLEEAVDKATEIDDPMDNVAQGMVNIGQPWATAPSRFVIPMDGTTGQTGVIPGISGTGVVALTHMEDGASTTGDVQPVALFTNPQGVYNTFSGTWDSPPGHVWNVVSAKSSGGQEPKNAGAKIKFKRNRELNSSDDEEAAKPRKKRLKAAVRQTTTDDKKKNIVKSNGVERSNSGQQARGNEQASSVTCFRCGQEGHWSRQCTSQPRPKCYACGKLGHYARNCTDTEAKARNDAYMKQRSQETLPTAGNASRAQ
ncbi:hypothetical protein L914_19527 [Phytophthora nicotianae]|uniref:CCHC-type domain-containing protein n=1 Tax=Phytophthora nicotianae TaxID=4792 RepID=W2MCF6_PHYNI|nr:hypothetical protein L914_19527 [Phytophthora nicotianae]